MGHTWNGIKMPHDLEPMEKAIELFRHQVPGFLIRRLVDEFLTDLVQCFLNEHLISLNRNFRITTSGIMSITTNLILPNIESDRDAAVVSHTPLDCKIFDQSNI